MSNKNNLKLEFDGSTLRAVASICPDPVIAVDRDGLIIHFNRSAANLLGYLPEEVIGKLNISKLYGSQNVGRSIKKIIYSDRWGGTGQIEGYETSLVTSKGGEIPIRLSAAVLLERGVEIGSVGFFHDLSAAKAMETRLRHICITDDLSDLYNRRHFNTILIEEMQRSIRYRRPLSLIYMDVDHFKEVNDLMGHQEGDRIIRAIADVIRDSLRRTDMAFRYGGDEFLALLPESDLAEAVALAKRVCNVAALRVTSRESDSQVVDVTLSLGVVEFDMKEKAQELLKRADHAMYNAKGSGGNCVSSNLNLVR